MLENFINLSKLFSILDPEPYFLICGLSFFAWGFYKLFLGEVSIERHKRIKSHYQNLLTHLLIFTILFATYILISKIVKVNPDFKKIHIYTAIITFFWGIVAFVKACRITILQYLFLGSMQVGVPLLLVNIISLLLYIVLFFWGISNVFGIKLTPILATSAAFSIILGLALQDTLGHLFAGISLQIDNSFEIGQWLEVNIGGQKVVGQVQEITWRATILLGFADELITIPNRVMASAHISNFTNFGLPIIRRQVFRIKHNENIEKAKQCLKNAIKKIPEIVQNDNPYIFVQETTESWIDIRVAYYIANFGQQYTIGDKVVTQVIHEFRAASIELASTQIQVLKNS